MQLKLEVYEALESWTYEGEKTEKGTLLLGHPNEEYFRELLRLGLIKKGT